MTNEQLAELIGQGGNEELLPLLWEKTSALVYMIIGRYHRAMSETFERHGYSLSDIRQEGYNALLFAVKQYDSAKPYKFTTYLNYAVKHTIRGLLSGKSDALNREETCSLDAPLDTEDADSDSLHDITPDPESGNVFIEIDKAGMFDPLHEEVDSLPEREREVIKRYYFNGESLKAIGATLGISIEAVRVIRNRGLNLLRTGKRGKRLRELYPEYIPHAINGPLPLFHHKGLSAFFCSRTSEVEEAALRNIARQEQARKE